MSYVIALHHIVISTKDRQMTIVEEHKRDLYAYIFRIINNKGYSLKRMNGIGKHIHLLVDIGAVGNVADLVRDIKRASNYWIKHVKSEWFPSFNGWGKEYASFSVSPQDMEMIINYIKNQEKHHHIEDYDDEMLRMLKSFGITPWQNGER